jgi:hypothetical protein
MRYVLVSPLGRAKTGHRSCQIHHRIPVHLRTILSSYIPLNHIDPILPHPYPAQRLRLQVQHHIPIPSDIPGIIRIAITSHRYRYLYQDPGSRSYQPLRYPQSVSYRIRYIPLSLRYRATRTETCPVEMGGKEMRRT